MRVIWSLLICMLCGVPKVEAADESAMWANLKCGMSWQTVSEQRPNAVETTHKGDPALVEAGIVIGPNDFTGMYVFASNRLAEIVLTADNIYTAAVAEEETRRSLGGRFGPPVSKTEADGYEITSYESGGLSVQAYFQDNQQLGAAIFFVRYTFIDCPYTD